MASQRWMLTVCFSLASVLGAGDSLTTTDTLKYTCRTFGSGVVRPFNGSGYYVRSNCPFTLTRFTHNRVECDITTRRGDNGLLVQVEIIINKIRTVLQNGSVSVEKMSVSLPYDHTYQHVFQYGIYTKLRSLLLPLSVTWHNVPGGIDTLWVELEQELSTDMTGLCGQHNVSGTKQQLIAKSVLTDDTCQTRDPVSTTNSICSQFLSQALDCLQARVSLYVQLCQENMYNYEKSKYIGCAFFKEVVQQCGNKSYVWNTWRTLTKCVSPTCPGDLVYVEQGTAFVPTCSNPNPSLTNQEPVSSCVCPNGTVLNDRADVVHCVNVSNCPCVFGGRTYLTGEMHTTKCQSCLCDGGRWHCSENHCPAQCHVEGHFVTTFDGKQFVIPGKCTYMASQGLNWTITIQFSEREVTMKTVVLQVFQETFTFSYNSVKVGEAQITELYQSENTLVFWQSSMYVLVQTSFGLKIQVQMSPEIQLYITPPRNHTGTISGLCGNNNNDTMDDFTTSSGITENSAQPFALSWSVGTCAVNIPSTCSNRDNEIFADEKCSVLNNPTGIFAECHGHIATDTYHTACIQRTCNCGSNLQQCLCAVLGSYAKACASLGVVIGDWRKATNCPLQCQKNQEFSYNVQRCNHTCRSLSGPDPRCGLDDGPVEGCGCPEGTHLNQGDICTSKAECVCHYYGSVTPPGPVVIDGQQCLCENGDLLCSKDCGCRKGKVCVHCSVYPVDTAQKTCDSLSKPLSAGKTCDSGCYCPNDQLEDHRGNCVSLDNCTCVYGGKVFSPGEQVKTSCKTCVCHHAQWNCKDEPCPGKCQVYGNGHYQTFDSKWYRFDGHCQYTLVEDYCGDGNGSFSVKVGSVPCCDEALTCSRSIILDLKGEVTLTLSDMRVTRRLHKDWTLPDNSLYTTHSVGLFIIISVPSKGITLIWDKHTRITIKLHPNWRNQVCGLCGDFDSSEMNDLEISGSAGVSSPLAFGNSWKAAAPPCSDVTTEIFPCERNSYCSAWAQRRCMIITGDTFKDCHLKVDPDPYYQACVQESCSCQFEGKFLGFCTAVAAYAEACSELDVCIRWRTPDLCPVYCDYYNERGQCTWHYDACGEMLTCGRDNYFRHKLEGCYPRCPNEAPYYDENTGKCTKISNCTCYFNDTIIQPGEVVMIKSTNCFCENGTITCLPPPLPPPPPKTRSFPTPSSTTTTAVTSVSSTIPTTTTASSTETQTTMPSTSSTAATTSTTTVTSTTSTELYSTTAPTTSSPITSTTTTTASSTETQTTMPSATSTQATTSTTIVTTATSTELYSTTAPTTSSPITSTTTTTASSTETQTTMPSATSTAATTSTTTVTSATSTELYSTTAPTTSSPITSTTTITATTTPTAASATTGTSVPPTTQTSISELPTWSTMPSTTSTPTTISSVSSTTSEAWSTLLSTIPTTTTTTTTTTSTATATSSETTTGPYNTTAVTSSSLATSSAATLTTGVSTEPTTITNATESTTQATAVTESATSGATVTVPSTSDTTLSTSFTNATTMWRTDTQPSVTYTTETTTAQHTEQSPTTLESPTPLSTNATSAQTSGPTEITITEASTETFTSSMTTQPTTTTTESTMTHSSTSLAPSTTTAFMTRRTTPGELTTNTTSTTTEKTYSTSEATVSTQSVYTTVSTHPATYEVVTGPPVPEHSSPQVCNDCRDLKMKKSWQCGETWVEDCFTKTCSNGRIELTPVVCPQPTVPVCPRGQITKVSDGCCETWKCDCRCEIYGDPHYISFQGVTFDYLDDCTYILVEEQSPRHHLTIAVDNYYCVPGLQGSCAKGVILQYQGNIATLSINPDMYMVQASLNNVTIQPPNEQHGFRFETTGYVVSIYIPKVRSYVSLSPSYTLVVNLAMEHFVNNTQGQCGVCGGGSCIRRGGQIEADDCCDKTASDWVYSDPLKPACSSAARNIPCQSPSPTPTITPTPCPVNALCELLHHPVFSECSSAVNLQLIKKHCEFDSCTNPESACSSLEQAAKECRNAGICIDWRNLTNGSCDVPCPAGLVYKECHNKLDDFCFGGVRYPGASLERKRMGCFCPSGLFRAGNHSNTCVNECSYCKGPRGEPRLPGEVWQSNCNLCTCNNQTRTEECFPKPPEPAPVCGPSAVLVNTSCCGDQICVEKICTYNGTAYKVGDKWRDDANPCISFSCSKEGLQTETKACPRKNCPEEDRIWDNQNCCFTCNRTCTPKMSSLNLTIDNCTAAVQMPVCQGLCASQYRVVLSGDLQVEQKSRCCQEQSFEKRLVTVRCADLTARLYSYKHITSFCSSAHGDRVVLNPDLQVEQKNGCCQE